MLYLVLQYRLALESDHHGSAFQHAAFLWGFCPWAHDELSARPAGLDAGTTPSVAASTYSLAGPSQALRGGHVSGHPRRSKFKLLVQASGSLMLAAAGTGLAPFCAFIAERA